MNRKLLTSLAVVAMICASGALAQSADGNVLATANNAGIFTFSMTGATFDFGTVDANGMLSSTGVTGIRSGNTGVYTRIAAGTWTCNSAPRRTVGIAQASVTHTGNLPATQLAVRVPVVGAGTSMGYVAFGAGNLITGIADVGNGANAVSGTFDLQLTVDDVDDVGPNWWTVVLTTSGV